MNGPVLPGLYVVAPRDTASIVVYIMSAATRWKSELSSDACTSIGQCNLLSLIKTQNVRVFYKQTNTVVCLYGGLLNTAF